VPELVNLVSDMMRARAGLQADKGDRQIDNSVHKLATRYLDAQDNCAALVEANEAESILADVDADRGDGIGPRTTLRPTRSASQE
jgi:hypothetical protein